MILHSVVFISAYTIISISYINIIWKKLWTRSVKIIRMNYCLKSRVYFQPSKSRQETEKYVTYSFIERFLSASVLILLWVFRHINTYNTQRTDYYDTHRYQIRIIHCTPHVMYRRTIARNKCETST